MRRVFLIAAHQASRQLAFWSTLAALAALGLFAVLACLIGTSHYAARVDQYIQLDRQLTQDQLHSKGFTGFQADSALRVLRKPDPASALVRGLDTAAPSQWDLGPAGVLPSDTSGGDDPDGEIGPVIDLEFVVRVVFSLFAVMLGADALWSLRPAGSLYGIRGLASSAAPLWLGQLLGSTIVVAAGWVVVSLSVWFTTYMLGPLDVSATAPSILIRMTPLVLIYQALFVSIGAIAASRSSTSRSAYFMAAVAWFVISLLGPPTAIAISRLVVPTRPYLAMHTERVQKFTDRVHEGEFALGDALVGFLTAKDGRKPVGVDVLPDFVPQIGPIWRKTEIDSRLLATEMEQSWKSQRDRQRRFLSRLEWFSPGSILFEAASNTSGTGRASQSQWESAVNDFQRRMNQALFDDRPRLNIRLRTTQILAFDRRPFAKREGLPQFSQPTPPIRSAVLGATFWILAIYFCVASSIALLVFRRTAD